MWQDFKSKGSEDENTPLKHHPIDFDGLTPFPEVKQFSTKFKYSKVTKKTQKTVELFCTCRHPYHPGKSESMVECESCKEWFHRSCEDIPDIMFKQNTVWICKNASHGNQHRFLGKLFRVIDFDNICRAAIKDWRTPFLHQTSLFSETKRPIYI